ncbi:MAG: hypothetical protein PHO63_00860 [Bacilli bacterium]|nr:hypothetical protein [Bacilli bacterium]MDD4809347.1 hypothetical protein [Bacilli bacterium]
MDNAREILNSIFDGLTGNYKNDIYYLNKQASNYQDHPESDFIISEIAKVVNTLVMEAKKKDYTDQIYQQYINHEITKSDVDKLIKEGKINLNYYISKIDGKIEELKEKQTNDNFMNKVEKQINDIELQAKLNNIKTQLDANQGIIKKNDIKLTYSDISKIGTLIDRRLDEIKEINSLISRINQMISNLSEGDKNLNHSELQKLHHDIETKLNNLQNM